MLPTIALLSLAAVGANAHIAAWGQGMFCKGGNNSAVDDQNTNLVVNPLYDHPKEVWWMQADRGCDKVPPPAGEFMEVPAGGVINTELATNRAFTTLSYGGKYTTEWDDGHNRTEPWVAPGPGKCLGDNPDGLGGELHTTGVEDAAGTAFAISYESDISKVTMENLVVFTTKWHTPWYRKTSYDVPADLPPCPEGGCYCAWLWVPNGCGQPNMYMQNFMCKVTGSKSNKKLSPAKPPVWCKDDPSKCVKGAKQMIAWNQQTGNNVVVPSGGSPAYNSVMGWAEGAQNDIFEDSDVVVSSSASSTLPAAATTSAVQQTTTSAVQQPNTAVDTAAAVTTVPTTTVAAVSSAQQSSIAVDTSVVANPPVSTPVAPKPTTTTRRGRPGRPTFTRVPAKPTTLVRSTRAAKPTDSCGSQNQY